MIYERLRIVRQLVITCFTLKVTFHINQCKNDGEAVIPDCGRSIYQQLWLAGRWLKAKTHRRQSNSSCYRGQRRSSTNTGRTECSDSEYTPVFHGRKMCFSHPLDNSYLCIWRFHDKRSTESSFYIFPNNGSLMSRNRRTREIGPFSVELSFLKVYICVARTIRIGMKEFLVYTV